MRRGRLRLVVGLVALCFCTGTTQADEHGNIYGWGNDDFGQATVPGGSDFVAISAGYGHSLALKLDGSLVGWGDNSFGQATAPVGNDFVAIAAGYWHSLALKSDGSIVGWGWDDFGQATQPAGNDFVAIAAGWYHSLALKLDGSVVGWGAGEPGEMGWPHYGQATGPVGNDFVAIAAGSVHSLALKSDGSIVGWGRDDYGQATGPVGNDFVAIAAGGSHSLALKSDGSIVGWGLNNYGQATGPEGNDFVAIAAGGSHSLALKSDGSIVGWGRNDDGRATPVEGTGFFAIAAGGKHSLAINSDVLLAGWGWDDFGQATVPVGSDFVAIAAGSYHNLALKLDGSLVGWGDNGDGQATVPSGNDYVAIAAGGWHSLALKSDGTLVGWGYNGYGQATVPVGNDFVAIAARYLHSLALKSDSSIVGWGSNYNGEATPPEGNDFIAIAAGYFHGLALKSDGSIVAWGGNNWGQTTVPVGNDFVAIAAGVGHSLAIKSDGSIVGWGWDDFGQATPPAGNDFVAIAAGWYHSLALKSDGSLVGWGSDDYGESTPPAGNDFVGISAGTMHSLAIRNLPGDVNIDWRVDLVDFGIVSAGWMEVGCDGDNNFCSGADIDRMGDVGLNDLFMLAGNWLKGVYFPGPAFSPDPADGMSGANPGTELRWYVGGCAVSHNIYFGTSSPGEFQGNQISSTFDPGPLDCERTYYWRIDEVQADSSVVEGDVWSFTTGYLVGWWKFNESEGGNAYDSVGGHDGTLMGDPTWRPGDGKIGGALEFDGVGDYVEVEGYKGISGSNPRTVTAWVKTESNGSSLSIVRWGTAEISGGLWSNVIDADGKLRAAVVGGSVVGDTVINDNTWHHVAIVLPDKEDVKVEDILLYVDGEREYTTISSGSQTIDTAVGMDVLISLDGSVGLLDDVRVYSYALSWEEIVELADVSAFGPDPADGATDVNTRMELSWSAGVGVVSHDIYFGTSSPGEFQCNQTDTTFDPGALDLGTMYYWRVDEVQVDSSIVEGEVWSFTTGDLVGWWKLDAWGGTVASDSVGGHNGTLMGDPTWRPGDGKIGGALEFDGVGDYVEVAGYKGISGSNPRTVSAWVKVESTGSTFSIVRWGTEEINGGLWSNVINAAGNLRAAVVGGSVVGDTVINDNTWHHVAIVLPDKEDVKVEDILLYVDGEQESTIISLGSQTIDTAVGMDVLISLDGSVGLLDDVRIYNYALSEGEIGAMAGVL